MNSVLTVQLMGFFCCSNEIFCRDVGKYVLKKGDVMHMHPSTDNIRHIERDSMPKKDTCIQFFCLTFGATPKFYYSRTQLPKSGIKCLQVWSTEGKQHIVSSLQQS